MDYTSIIEGLHVASLFDLFRLRAALTMQLEDPQRIEQVRARLRPGMPLTYFDEVPQSPGRSLRHRIAQNPPASRKPA
jgi:hypothetical protein